ncbi:unnamed protein product [Lactuca saligna]|uniref:Uncharacterized protein n=1 Tax=Lactuca saligna TaxID=75948 RepID=A0AA35VEX3_LACSI|nr:unnamed protein product [Lactuca saligna]
MHESITTLFSSQSTEAERMIHVEEPDDDEIMVSFVDRQFDPEEENVPDNLIMSVTKLKEYVDLKFDELKPKLSKEVQKMENNYTLFHSKVDVITTAITKLVEFNNEYLNNQKRILRCLKRWKIFYPGKEKGFGGFGSSKDHEKWVVVGKVSSTQILTSLPISLTTTSTTTRALMNGISINEGVGGLSSSSIPPNFNNGPSNKGKAIYVVPLEEEKKKQQALDIEKQRLKNSILRRRDNDPPSLYKGVTNK